LGTPSGVETATAAILAAVDVGKFKVEEVCGK